MIPAPPGIVANFKDNKGPVLPQKVIAFDDDGAPMVLGTRGLIHASNYANFDGISYDTLPGVTAVIPAGGWRVEHTGDDGTTWSQTLVGWGLRTDGEIVPLDTDRDGYVESLGDTGCTYRIYHPDTARAPEAS